MLLEEIKYCYKDIAIKPAIVSYIEHRSDCYPFKRPEFYGEPMLPIFTAPMSSVVNEKNFGIFEENNIIPILPRNIDLIDRIQYIRKGKWVALGLQEFEDLFVKNTFVADDMRVLIDIANGHMYKLHDLVKKTRQKNYKRLQIMVGNIANPETYELLSNIGVDYVRLSVGTGNGCLSSSQTGIHYPIASLINETYQIKNKLIKCGINPPKIIADGGIRNYDDVIKSLALGADYVMIGSVLSQLVESAAPLYYVGRYGRLVEIKEEFEFNEDGTIYLKESNATVSKPKKLFYGMASRRGQIDLMGSKNKTSEGVEKMVDVTTTIKKWSENMIDYINSAMSYTNIRNVSNFNPDNVDCIIISPLTRESINK